MHDLNGEPCFHFKGFDLVEREIPSMCFLLRNDFKINHADVADLR